MLQQPVVSRQDLVVRVKSVMPIGYANASTVPRYRYIVVIRARVGGDLIAVQFRHVSVGGHPNIYIIYVAFDSNTTSVTGVPAIESATLGYVLVRERTGG